MMSFTGHSFLWVHTPEKTAATLSLSFVVTDIVDVLTLITSTIIQSYLPLVTKSN